MTTVAYYADLSGVAFFLGPLGQQMSWVHALPGGTYQHPVYGELKFDDPKIGRYVESVVKKYRTIDPDIDYDHKQDPAMGNRAAGWVKNAEARPGQQNNDLWLLVEWTPAGHKSVKEKEFRYFSSELADEWTDPQGTKYKDVVFGGGVTNRPYMKNLVPLNLSELSFKDTSEKALDEGDQVDPKELRRKLGLSETATDAEVDARIATLSEATKLKDPAPIDPNVDALKALAESNPVIKAFMDQMAETNKMLKESQERAKLAETQARLQTLTSAKLSFSAATLNEVTALMVGAPAQLNEKLYSILKSVVDGTGITNLGETGSVDPEGRRSNDGAVGGEKAFNDKVKEFEEKRNLTYFDALTAVGKEHPELYENYRRAVYIPADA